MVSKILQISSFRWLFPPIVFIKNTVGGLQCIGTGIATMTEMHLQTNICQGGFLKELAIPLADAMEGVSVVFSSAAVGAKQGVTKATAASVHSIISTDSTRPWRWRSLPLHEQLHVVAEHGKPLPEIIILTLQHRIREVGDMKVYRLPETSPASVD